MVSCLYCAAVQYRFLVETKFSGVSYGYGSFPHHEHCEALRESAGAGCRMCGVILEAITRKCLEAGLVGPDGDPMYPEGQLEVGGAVVGVRPVWAKRPGSDLEKVGELRTVAVPADWEDPWDAVDAPMLDIMVAAVDRWIARCAEQHDACPRNTQSDFVPTRLVDVSGPDLDTVRLLDAGCGTMPADAPYVALSHCWGLTMPDSAKTTEENVAQHRRAIPLADLSNTFVDAIRFTRSLGIPHIWIDSLCIIQNSVSDWEREAAQMASIYSQARVTLAASGSSDGSQGCGVGSLGREVWWPYVDSHLPGGLRFRMCSWSAKSGDTVDRDPLHQRGWTLQERELSPRVVHFSKDGLRWECRCLRASLHFPWGDTLAMKGYGRVLDDNRGHGKTLRAVLPLSNSQATVDPGLARLAMFEWFHLVRLYSRRLLTQPSDALPAISGLARVFDGFTRGEYHAGFFTSHGPLGLLWSRDGVFKDSAGNKRRACRPPGYTAPSWSWASVIGAVTWSLEKVDATEEMASIIRVATIPRFTDPLGQLRDGLLEIAGPFIPLLTKPAAGIYQDTQASGHTSNADVFAEVKGKLSKVGFMSFDVQEDMCDSVYGLACARDGQSSIFGLALAPVNLAEKQFRRVGHFRSNQLPWRDGAPTEYVTII